MGLAEERERGKSNPGGRGGGTSHGTRRWDNVGQVGQLLSPEGGKGRKTHAAKNRDGLSQPSHLRCPMGQGMQQAGRGGMGSPTTRNDFLDLEMLAASA
jgi:hypothetical protein